MAVHLGTTLARGGTNLGIYSCRPIPGSSVWSLHAEGRAVDLGIPVGAAWGAKYVQALVDVSGGLGVQLVIYRDRYWSCRHADAGWRPYSGDSRHLEHAHVELTPDAAAGLTVERCKQVLLPVIPPPAPPGGAHPPGSRVLRVRDPIMTGPDVVFVQKWIGKSHCGTADGEYGPNTAAGVRWYQRMRGLAVDGEVGRDTFGQMNVRWSG